MPGLIDSTEGLSYGIGLFFEAGLGGDGLNNPEAVENAIRFKGAGSLSANTKALLAASGAFSSGGGLSAITNVQQVASVRFVGGGTLTAQGS